jgi:hypothetical protein
MVTGRCIPHHSTEQPEVIISNLEWHPTDMIEPLHLDVLKYCAEVFGEHAL